MSKVLVPLAEGCEEIEAVTIIDLLRRAGITVVVAGLKEGPVTASRGVVLVPDTTLDAVADQEFDMIALPGGGPGADALRDDDRVVGLLKRMSEGGRVTAAICAAPKVLAAAGLLEGRRATAYPGTLEGLDLPTTTIKQTVVETDGTVITSRGPGTAMDFALHLIETLEGEAKRAEIAAELLRP